VVLDAGSTDGSVEIIRNYEKSLAWWRTYPDGGYAAALNEGFSKATGDVLSFINSDDVLLPGSLHAAGSAFSKSPSTRLVFGKCLMIDSDDRITYRICGVRPTFRSMLLWSMAGFTQPGTFFSKEVYERIGQFNTDIKLAADFDFFLKVLRV
jgi:glycosyltransferase involved in cell wall biosynthesis